MINHRRTRRADEVGPIVGIDWSNSVTSGLSFAFDPSSGRDWFSGGLHSVPSLVTPAGGAPGTASPQFYRAQSSGHVTATRRGDNPGRISLLLFITPWAVINTFYARRGLGGTSRCDWQVSRVGAQFGGRLAFRRTGFGDSTYSATPPTGADSCSVFIQQGPNGENVASFWFNGAPASVTADAVQAGDVPLSSNAAVVQVGPTLVSPNRTGAVFTWSRFLTDAERESVIRNPGQIWKRRPWRQALTAYSASVSIYRPGTDISVAGWTGTPTASPIAANMAETTRDDAGYAQSPPLSGTAQDGIFTLDNTVPIGTWGVTYAARHTGVGQVRMSLLDGSNTPVGVGAWQALTGAFAEYTDTITTSGTAARIQIEVKT